MKFKRSLILNNSENKKLVFLTSDQIDIFVDKDTICYALNISDEPYCPDGRKGCLVAHGNPLTERVACLKGISKEDAVALINKVISEILLPDKPITFKFNPEPKGLNDDWLNNIKVDSVSTHNR